MKAHYWCIRQALRERAADGYSRGQPGPATVTTNMLLIRIIALFTKEVGITDVFEHNSPKFWIVALLKRLHHNTLTNMWLLLHQHGFAFAVAFDLGEAKGNVCHDWHGLDARLPTERNKLRPVQVVPINQQVEDAKT